jgi:hypothetical protein
MDRGTKGERLDSSGRELRWIFLLCGLFLIGLAGSLVLREGGDATGKAVGAILFGGSGLVLVVIAAAWRRSCFTPEGLLRTSWLGRSLVPWSAVETIEVDELPARHETVGVIRLRRSSGRRVSIRVKAWKVDMVADRIAAACPGAFVDDRRTGEVTAPREASVDAAALGAREDAVRRRSARGLAGTGALWISAAVVCAAAAAIVGALRLRRHPAEALLSGGMLALVAAFAFRHGLLLLRLARHVREE